MAGTVDSLIDRLGGTGAVAAGLALPKSTVSTWRERGIPPGRWSEVVRFASTQGCADVTLDVLAGLQGRSTAGASA